MTYLDAPSQLEELIEHVVADNLQEAFELNPLARPNGPGGGASLFRIDCSSGPYMMKVKHSSIRVESRLESENEFSRTPSLMNEYQFFRTLPVNWIPGVRFFAEQGDFQFLATEWLDTFASATPNMSATELLSVWNEIVAAVRHLYDLGVVHTDIHEHNILFRGRSPIICDFEEARYLKQDVPFSDSLDFAGRNKYGNVGEMTIAKGERPGLTCLLRLRLLFRDLVSEKVREMLPHARFDGTCPFNRDPLQEPDSRVYQALDFPDLAVEGHRPTHDIRMKIFDRLLAELARKTGSVSHVDIGSNLGAFCLHAATRRSVKTSIGIEAFQLYSDIAQSLGFIYDRQKAFFICTIAGTGRLTETLEMARVNRVDFISMLSVYHHIEGKDVLLQDLKKIGAEYLLAEFATEPRYYPERGGLQGEVTYFMERAGYTYSYLISHSPDYGRPIFLFSKERRRLIDLLTFEVFCFGPSRLRRLRGRIGGAAKRILACTIPGGLRR